MPLGKKGKRNIYFITWSISSEQYVCIICFPYLINVTDYVICTLLFFIPFNTVGRTGVAFFPNNLVFEIYILLYFYLFISRKFSTVNIVNVMCSRISRPQNSREITCQFLLNLSIFKLYSSLSLRSEFLVNFCN